MNYEASACAVTTDEKESSRGTRHEEKKYHAYGSQCKCNSNSNTTPLDRLTRDFVFNLNQMRALLFFIFSLFFSSFVVPDHNLGFCTDQHMSTLGGLRDSNPEIDSLARFAVERHNSNQNASFELVRVVKAQEQVVSGTLHHLTLEVVDTGKKKLYEAKIWVKPWMNFKELQEFKHVGDVPCFTSSDLGVKKDERGSGWQSVPVHDPLVQDAAQHAVCTIQARSNSLFPYELAGIIHANAEVAETLAKFDILLKVKRGEKEEKFKVEVHRNNEGGFQLNKMDVHH